MRSLLSVGIAAVLLAGVSAGADGQVASCAVKVRTTKRLVVKHAVTIEYRRACGARRLIVKGPRHTKATIPLPRNRTRGIVYFTPARAGGYLLLLKDAKDVSRARLNFVVYAS